LLSIGDTVLNFFNLIKDLIFISWKSVFFGIETFTDSVDFINQDITRFDDDNER